MLTFVWCRWHLPQWKAQHIFSLCFQMQGHFLIWSHGWGLLHISCLQNHPGGICLIKIPGRVLQLADILSHIGLPLLSYWQQNFLKGYSDLSIYAVLNSNVAWNICPPVSNSSLALLWKIYFWYLICHCLLHSIGLLSSYPILNSSMPFLRSDSLSPAKWWQTN